MRTEALTCPELAGYLREGDEVRITGVFSSAVYFEGPRGDVLMLFDAEYGLVPFGLAVRDAKGLIAEAKFAVGGKGAAGAGFVRLQAREFHLSVRPHRQPPRGRPDAELLREALGLWRGQLRETEKGSLWSEKLLFAAASAKKRAELLSALEGASPEGIKQALEGLLGLGTGLTPSLDDYLSALCALLIWAREVWGLPDNGAEPLAAAIRLFAPAKTSRISAAYLLASATGERAQRIEDVLAEPVDADAVRALLEVGGGSGGDMLAGLIAGLEHTLRKY